MQPIRTFAELPIEFQTPLPEPFTYQEIKAEVVRLFEQGLSYFKIGQLLGVTGKTAKKAISKP